MTTKNRILSLALSLLMVVALFAPISVVFASDSLTIVAASDNGGTSATSGAEQAIANLGTGSSWYSANRANLENKTSIATYTLQNSSFVDSVAIAFYYSDQRSFTFSIEYSMDGENWDEALPSTQSAQQAVDKTAETFTFAESVEALYLRVKITDARVLATGATNNYGAFYTFEAFGEVDPNGIGAPAVDDALIQAIADADALASSESLYRPESWATLTALLPAARALVGADYTYQDDIDAATAAINAAIKNLCPVDQVLAFQAYQTEGPAHANSIYHAHAACPNLRDQDGVWYSANANGDYVTSAIFALPVESELYAIELDWYKGTERKYEFSIYVSLDKENWVEIVAPGTVSAAETTTYVDLTAVDEYEGTALYVRFDSADGFCYNADGTANTNGWVALSEIRFFGDEVEGGAVLPANYDAVDTWKLIQMDLTESLYTPASWANFNNAIQGVDYTLGARDQATVDAAVVAIKAAYAALTFQDLNGLQISQSVYGDSGAQAWTNATAIFTESGYTLDQYKIGTMTLQNWTRIIAAPTATDGVYEITAIYTPGTAVSADEAVPEGGFAIAMNVNDDVPDEVPYGSQYASQEFANRNNAAWTAMALAVGDKVQLNNMIWTPEDFEAEGEVMQAAWLETTGSWKHRYWDTAGLGSFTPTIINRPSNKTDADGNYLARDEFEDFTTASTLTKVDEPTSIIYATDNGGTTATSTAIEAVPGLGSGESWYSANRNVLTDKISYATFYLNQASTVEGVSIAFYKATERSFEFSIEYSMDNEIWEEALPATWSAQQAAEMDAEDFFFDVPVDALYIRVKITDARVLATGATNNYGAFYTIEVFGETISGGATPVLPAADYSAVETWKLIQMDLTESLYTTDSWANFDAAIQAVNYNYTVLEQDKIAEEVAAIKAAYAALTFQDLNGLAISHAVYGDSGAVAWTNATAIFTESGYTLDQYTVSGMTLQNWTRIIAVPTATDGVYEISAIITPGTAVTKDEAVPEGGFAIAMNVNDDIPDEVPYGSQYASQEFANRNNAAFAALELAVGDKVQLNNMIWTPEDFEAEGEEMQAAWLETEGVWCHRYWSNAGFGEITPTIINRPSNKTDADGNYLARDQFEGFTTASTLTKVEAPEYVIGDIDGNGELGALDIAALAQYLAGWDVEIVLDAADTDGNGELGALDIAALAQYLAGWDVTLG